MSFNTGINVMNTSQTRFQEHINLDGPLKLHLHKCGSLEVPPEMNNVLTLEALFIRDIKPKLNTKEEYKSRALIIRS